MLVEYRREDDNEGREHSRSDGLEEIHMGIAAFNDSGPFRVFALEEPPDIFKCTCPDERMP